ncbi:MAG TPA: hypothetical protein DCG24_09585 [Bacteroidetes bacterium]|nr:hypothetical protein [Bacteroidota bacterium]
MKKGMLFIAAIMLLFMTKADAVAQVQDNVVLTDMGNGLYEVAVYYEDGRLQEKGYMTNGQSTEQWVRYSPEGTILAVASYNESGEKDGIWNIYSTSGELAFELVYENNVRTMARSFDTEGDMVSYRVQ